MRQAGYLAAAGIFALENNIDRLADDHLHVQLIAKALAPKDFTGTILPVETNILIFEVKGKYTPASFAERLLKDDIKVTPISKTQVRIVLHLDITKEMVEKTIKVIEEL
jgi:threonine aldolase